MYPKKLLWRGRPVEELSNQEILDMIHDHFMGHKDLHFYYPYDVDKFKYAPAFTRDELLAAVYSLQDQWELQHTPEAIRGRVEAQIYMFKMGLQAG